MRAATTRGLLETEDDAAVQRVNPGGRSPVLLIGDHAGVAVPRALGDLGLPRHVFGLHVAQDIGIRALGEALAARLDAVFLWQNYSRLVIDCNRDPAAPDAMPAVSDGIAVPGNVGLDDAARAARVAAIHDPFQAAIAEALAMRRVGGARPALVSLHSFTPLMGGVARPWHVGLLHAGHEDAMGLRMIDLLRGRGDLVVGDNEPYDGALIGDGMNTHGTGRGFPHVLVEIRQDLVAEESGQAAWAARLARLVPPLLDLPETAHIRRYGSRAGAMPSSQRGQNP